MRSQLFDREATPSGGAVQLQPYLFEARRPRKHPLLKLRELNLEQRFATNQWVAGQIALNPWDSRYDNYFVSLLHQPWIAIAESNQLREAWLSSTLQPSRANVTWLTMTCDTGRRARLLEVPLFKYLGSHLDMLMVIFPQSRFIAATSVRCSILSDLLHR